jgi:diacylglycerol kinase family enzyme
MNKYETVRLLYALNTGEFDTVLKKRSWATNSIRIKSDKIFNIEFDGEVIQTDDVTISVKQKFIQVCQ